jgi:ferric-dicitrate binding protein FerR (iron transport regulator)
MADRHGDDSAREEEARRALERVERDSELLGRSTMARTVDRARAHMAADDADNGDPVEVWGRRVGRGLSVAAFIILAIWLVQYLGR